MMIIPREFSSLKLASLLCSDYLGSRFDPKNAKIKRNKSSSTSSNSIHQDLEGDKHPRKPKQKQEIIILSRLVWTMSIAGWFYLRKHGSHHGPTRPNKKLTNPFFPYPQQKKMLEMGVGGPDGWDSFQGLCEADGLAQQPVHLLCSGLYGHIEHLLVELHHQPTKNARINLAY